MNNSIYILGGIISIGIGLWIIVPQIKAYFNDVKDEYGFKIGVFIGGIMFVMIGVVMIYQNI